MKIAIVTGASSGLGQEFVRQIIKKERLDSIWIIARRESRLKEIARISPARIRLFPLDLNNPESFSSLRATLEQEKPDVRLLVNAAGFGKMGNYAEISEKDANAMIDLNCKALVNMTQIVLPYMKRGARILEICSVASFQPLPSFNIYAASKAFVQSYSRGLRWELLNRGIHVTAVCPYWIKDTEFISVSKKEANHSAVRHFPLASHVRSIAMMALNDSRLNLPVSTPGPVCFLQRVFTKFIPREIVIACWEGIRRI